MKEKKNVLLLAPLTGNGGIQSWTKKYINTFSDDTFHLVPVGVSKRRSLAKKADLFHRIVDGLMDMIEVRNEVKRVIKANRIAILHTTTSGDLGSLRDIVIARLCHRHGVKTIMHCRYGCIPEDYKRRDMIGRLLRRSTALFDHIWVLDQRTYNYLRTIDSLKNKVFLTPNSIEVKDDVDDSPKDYKRIAFVGNLIPSKGLFELTEAAIKCDVILDIIGPGSDEVNKRICSIAGDQLEKKVFIHGKLPNTEAVRFMHDVDIIALPTYYPWEAFPISILEAMSLTKMVISCPRAAVPDMLTGLDGQPCGMLVPEKSVQGIIDAINWCQTHKNIADQMCRKAYEKVYSCYRMDVVYDIYRRNYKLLLG